MACARRVRRVCAGCVRVCVCVKSKLYRAPRLPSCCVRVYIAGFDCVVPKAVLLACFLPQLSYVVLPCSLCHEPPWRLGCVYSVRWRLACCGMRSRPHPTRGCLCLLLRLYPARLRKRKRSARSGLHLGCEAQHALEIVCALQLVLGSGALRARSA